MSSYEERVQAEKGCQIELRKQKIGGTAEFRKWAVRNHPDKGGKLRVFQKVSGCVDLMYKASEGDSPRASTSYSQPSSRSPGRKTKSRSSSSGPRSETFWSAFEEFEVDEDILFGRAGASRRREREREREQHYERAYGFRGSSPMEDDVMFESWDEFEAYVQTHMRGRERAAHAAEQKAKDRRRARRRKAEAERKEAEAERKRNGTERKGRPGAEARRGPSPEDWQGPANPYQAPGSSEHSRPRPAHEQTPRERGRAAAQEALQRLRQTFCFEGFEGWREPRRRGNSTWRHRLSRPQVAFMVAQLTCMQSVFLSTAFPRF